MANSLDIIYQNIVIWWNFIWETEVPQTGFTFGAFYAFLLVFSLGLFVFRLATHSKDKDGD